MAGNAPAAAPPLLLSLLCAAAALLLLPSTGEAAGPDTLMRRPLIPHSPGLLLAQPELLKARVAVAGAGCTSLDGPYGCDVLAVGSGSGGAPEPVHPGRRGGGGLRIHVREGRQSLRGLLRSVLEDEVVYNRREVEEPLHALEVRWRARDGVHFLLCPRPLAAWAAREPYSTKQEEHPAPPNPERHPHRHKKLLFCEVVLNRPNTRSFAPRPHRAMLKSRRC